MMMKDLGDIFYSNGTKKYDSFNKSFFYPNGATLYDGFTGNIYYEDGIKAYDAFYADVYYRNGVRAFNAFYGDSYTPSGKKILKINEKGIQHENFQIKFAKDPKEYELRVIISSKTFLNITSRRLQIYLFDNLIVDQNK